MGVYMMLQPLFMLATPPNNLLKGTITDNKGNPLPGVTVIIPDLKVGAVSDGEGYYIIKQLPSGKYLVEVRAIGFATVTRTVLIEGAAIENFKLEESILEKTELIVTGASHATEERRSVTPIQSIRMKEMRENAYSNIIDAIAKLPGVNQVATGPAISKPVIRGLGMNRVITLNDGIRQEGQQWGDEHGIEIDDYNVSRIEVLKGPASLVYGSDALAGVINIISDDIIPRGKISGNIISNYQTNNGLAAWHTDIAGNSGGFVWKIFGTSKWAHDYKNAYDGYVFNSRFNNMNYGAMMGIDRKWGNSRLSFTMFNQRLGLVEGKRDSATGRLIKEVNNDNVAEELLTTDADGREYTASVPSQKITHAKIAWNTSVYQRNGGRIALILGYQQNLRKEFADVLAPGIAGLQFQLRTGTYDIKYYYPVWKGWQITSGMNGMIQKNENKGSEYLIPDYSMFDAGVYTVAKKDWKKLSVSGGLRYSYRNMNTTALFLDSNDAKTASLEIGGYQQFKSFSKEYSTIAASAGLSYLLSKRMALKLNLSTGFRAPNAAELSANGVHEGTIRYEYGNTSLKAENSVQADLGVNWNSEHIMINAAAFYNYINNYIYLRKLISANGTDSIPEVDNEDAFAAFEFSQSAAGLYGGELYIDFHPHPFDWLHLDNTVSLVRGILFNGTDSTRHLPNLPPLRWQIELRAQTKSIGKRMKNAYLKFGANVNFTQNNVFSAYNTETVTPGYTLLNAGIGADFTDRKKHLLCSISFAIQNITDLSYQDHLNRLKYGDLNNITGKMGVFNQGRNLSIILNLPLDIK